MQRIKIKIFENINIKSKRTLSSQLTFIGWIIKIRPALVGDFLMTEINK